MKRYSKHYRHGESRFLFFEQRKQKVEKVYVPSDYETRECYSPQMRRDIYDRVDRAKKNLKQRCSGNPALEKLYRDFNAEYVRRHRDLTAVRVREKRYYNRCGCLVVRRWMGVATFGKQVRKLVPLLNYYINEFNKKVRSAPAPRTPERTQRRTQLERINRNTWSIVVPRHKTAHFKIGRYLQWMSVRPNTIALGHYQCNGFYIYRDRRNSSRLIIHSRYDFIVNIDGQSYRPGGRPPSRRPRRETLPPPKNQGSKEQTPPKQETPGQKPPPRETPGQKPPTQETPGQKPPSNETPDVTPSPTKTPKQQAREQYRKTVDAVLEKEKAKLNTVTDPLGKRILTDQLKEFEDSTAALERAIDKIQRDIEGNAMTAPENVKEQLEKLHEETVELQKSVEENIAAENFDPFDRGKSPLPDANQKLRDLERRRRELVTPPETSPPGTSPDPFTPPETETPDVPRTDPGSVTPPTTPDTTPPATEDPRETPSGQTPSAAPNPSAGLERKPSEAGTTVEKTDASPDTPIPPRDTTQDSKPPRRTDSTLDTTPPPPSSVPPRTPQTPNVEAPQQPAQNAVERMQEEFRTKLSPVVAKAKEKVNTAPDALSKRILSDQLQKFEDDAAAFDTEAAKLQTDIAKNIDSEADEDTKKKLETLFEESVNLRRSVEEKIAAEDFDPFDEGKSPIPQARQALQALEQKRRELVPDPEAPQQPAQKSPEQMEQEFRTKLAPVVEKAKEKVNTTNDALSKAILTDQLKAFEEGTAAFNTEASTVQTDIAKNIESEADANTKQKLEALFEQSVTLRTSVEEKITADDFDPFDKDSSPIAQARQALQALEQERKELVPEN